MIIAQSAIKKQQEHEAKIQELQEELLKDSGKPWDFFDSLWVEPQKASGLKVYRYDYRHYSVAMCFTSLEDAVRYAQKYDGKRAKVCKITDGNSASVLPATVLDSSYQKSTTYTRAIEGDAYLEVEGSHTGWWSRSCLRFYIVEDDTPESRYVTVACEIKSSHLLPARYGSTYRLSWPKGVRLEWSYGSCEPIRYCADGTCVSGRYHHIGVLGAQHTLADWLPMRTSQPETKDNT